MEKIAQAFEKRFFKTGLRFSSPFQNFMSHQMYGILSKSLVPTVYSAGHEIVVFSQISFAPEIF
jgi:hypothetical protein